MHKKLFLLLSVLFWSLSLILLGVLLLLTVISKYPVEEDVVIFLSFLMFLQVPDSDKVDDDSISVSAFDLTLHAATCPAFSFLRGRRVVPPTHHCLHKP